MIVVSDTGPIHYLVLIGSEWLLPRLFGGVLVPPRVLSELRHPNAPEAVRTWARDLPSWAVERAPSSALVGIKAHPGELEALSLVREIGGSLLSDDAAALRIARDWELVAFGTLGILQRAHAAGLIEIRDALAKLARTNHHHTPALLLRVVAEAEAMRQANENGL